MGSGGGERGVQKFTTSGHFLAADKPPRALKTTGVADAEVPRDLNKGWGKGATVDGSQTGLIKTCGLG